MILRGRRKIVTEFTSTDLANIHNVVSLLNTSYPTHMANREEIGYLIQYHNGDQTILNKEKLVRPEINHKVVINHAQMITRMVNGYFLGTPIQYIQAGDSDKKTQIDELNRYVQYEDKASVDKEIGEYQSICGTAYRIVYTDGIFADETPFEEKALNPLNTYVVYENNIAEKPVVGVTYYTFLDANGFVDGYKVYAYTAIGLYEFRANSQGKIEETDTSTFTPYAIGGVPIIEYPNNMENR
jgi:SPP1 family phage portal protein